MIPKTTAPLTKFVRTLEGLLVLGSNVALVAIPIVTSSLTANQAVRYGVILNSAAVFSRSILKAVAALAAPKPPPPPAPGAFLGPDAYTGTSMSQIKLANSPAKPLVDAEGWPV